MQSTTINYCIFCNHSRCLNTCKLLTTVFFNWMCPTNHGWALRKASTPQPKFLKTTYTGIGDSTATKPIRIDGLGKSWARPVCCRPIYTYNRGTYSPEIISFVPNIKSSMHSMVLRLGNGDTILRLPAELATIRSFAAATDKKNLRRAWWARFVLM